MSPALKDARLSSTQETLLLSLERRLQLQIQAETNAFIMEKKHHQHQQDTDRVSRDQSNASVDAGAPTVKEFLASFTRMQAAEANKDHRGLSSEFEAFAAKIDADAASWDALYSHAHQSFALVEDMETSHAQVVAKTQALYHSFENVLQQVEALRTRVGVIAAPLPYFTAIDGIAQTLGFGVKFAPPSAGSAALGSAEAAALSLAAGQSAVQVFQHKRNVDPTSARFAETFEKIDASVAYLEAHPEYRDAACYLEAYRTLTEGAIQCLKTYAIDALDAAKDAVQEALEKSQAALGGGSAEAIAVSGSNFATLMDETSAYYVHFQLVAPALAAVTKQLERCVRMQQTASHLSGSDAVALIEVCDAYAAQRVQLLSPALSAYVENVAQSTDIVNLLRVSCLHVVQVCEAEFRLFTKLFGREPRDTLFSFYQEERGDDEDENDDDSRKESAFERLIFQLSSVLYSIMRPQILLQKDLDVLCEVIHVLQSEVIEGVIEPRSRVVGFVEPVMQRMIQDAQERLILCIQIYIRDEIEGFTPTPEDLSYPEKLVNPPSDAMYATWYPSLQHTLLCLSKVYHFVKMEIFEELAQDAIQICTASLRMAAADLTVIKGSLHGTLFLVKHLLTLREQITPFKINFAVTNRALDFTSSADAMNQLLSSSDVTSRLFSLSQNALVGMIPQVHETTSDAKKALEYELKQSCTAFIDAVLQQLAQPLLRVLTESQKPKATPIAPSRVAETLTHLSTNVQDVLPDIRHTIQLYLRNASTEAVLFKPVQRHLVDAVEQLKIILELQDCTSDEAQACFPVFQSLLEQLQQL